MGLLADTFETAITWDKWPEFDAEVRERVGRALKEVLGDGTSLSCRFTHVYPDGPAPYYSFSGVAKLGGESRNGARSKKRRRTRSSTPAARSRTITRSAGCIARVGTATPAAVRRGAARGEKTARSEGLLNPGVLLD